MDAKGSCHCGSVGYTISGEPIYHALCHCSDCRRATGAPAVSWALFPQQAVTITGETKTYVSSEHGRRHFCPDCGTSLFYTNEAVFPGLIDVQSATLEEPGALPLRIEVQTAERIGWMSPVHGAEQFERYPAGPE